MVSEVWEHFTKFNKDSAKCVKCSSVVKCTGGSTSGLYRNISSIHSTNVSNKRKVSESAEMSPPKVQKKIYEFMVEKSLKGIVSELFIFT